MIGTKIREAHNPIDENSPLYKMTKEVMMEGETEILILLKAFDDTFSQTVHSRASYVDEQIIFNQRFENLISHDNEGITILDLSKLSKFED